MNNQVIVDLQNIYIGHFNINYRGIPTAKCPFDYVLYQMVINEVKPDLIIEIGAYKGGSALYMADLLNAIGKGIVHTIDIEDRVESSLVLNHGRIKYFTKGYQDYDLENTKGFEKILVIDDGSHYYGDVIATLNKFKDVVTKGSYLIVEDGIINELNARGHMSLDFGGGPLRAIEEFLLMNRNFIIDHNYCDFFGKNATYIS